MDPWVRTYQAGGERERPHHCADMREFVHFFILLIIVVRLR
jgi:hypothetical protein